MSIDQNKEVVILWLEERDKGNWDIIKEATVANIDIYRIVDGRIVEQ